MYHHPPFRFPLGKYILIWLVILSFGQSFLKEIHASGEASSVRVVSIRARDLHAGYKLVVGSHRYMLNEVHVDPKEVTVVYKDHGRFVDKTFKRMHRVKVIRPR